MYDLSKLQGLLFSFASISILLMSSTPSYANGLSTFPLNLSNIGVKYKPQDNDFESYKVTLEKAPVLKGGNGENFEFKPELHVTVVENVAAQDADEVLRALHKRHVQTVQGEQIRYGERQLELIFIRGQDKHGVNHQDLFFKELEYEKALNKGAVKDRLRQQEWISNNPMLKDFVRYRGLEAEDKASIQFPLALGAKESFELAETELDPRTRKEVPKLLPGSTMVVGGDLKSIDPRLRAAVSEPVKKLRERVGEEAWNNPNSLLFILSRDRESHEHTFGKKKRTTRDLFLVGVRFTFTGGVSHFTTMAFYGVNFMTALPVGLINGFNVGIYQYHNEFISKWFSRTGIWHPSQFKKASLLESAGAKHYLQATHFITSFSVVQYLLGLAASPFPLSIAIVSLADSFVEGTVFTAVGKGTHKHAVRNKRNPEAYDNVQFAGALMMSQASMVTSGVQLVAKQFTDTGRTGAALSLLGGVSLFGLMAHLAINSDLDQKLFDAFMRRYGETERVQLMKARVAKFETTPTGKAVMDVIHDRGRRLTVNQIKRKLKKPQASWNCLDLMHGASLILSPNSP